MWSTRLVSIRLGKAPAFLSVSYSTSASIGFFALPHEFPLIPLSYVTPLLWDRALPFPPGDPSHNFPEGKLRRPDRHAAPRRCCPSRDASGRGASALSSPQRWRCVPGGWRWAGCSARGCCASRPRCPAPTRCGGRRAFQWPPAPGVRATRRGCCRRKGRGAQSRCGGCRG